MNWEAEARRLRAGIAEFLHGSDNARPRAIIFRKDGIHSKHDQCPHGQTMYDGCENCAYEYFERLLAQSEEPS